MCFSRTVLFATVATSCLVAASAEASTLVIEDSSNNIGFVDTTTGAVSNVQHLNTTLTDIAFTSNGSLYGTSFTTLYQLSPTLSNGTETAIGPGGGFNVSVNALVGNGTGLLAAANNSTTIYNLSTTNGALTSSAFNSAGHVSAGDLAFVGSTLYESGVCGGVDCLINASTGHVIGDFTHNGSTFNDLFGLAYDGTTLWGVAGTDIFMVNVATGVLTDEVSFANNKGLGDGNGAAAALLATPIPAALPLFAGGLGMVGWLSGRKKRKAQTALASA